MSIFKRFNEAEEKMNPLTKGYNALVRKHKAIKATRATLAKSAETATKQYFKKKKMTPTPSYRKEVKDKYLKKYTKQIKW